MTTVLTRERAVTDRTPPLLASPVARALILVAAFGAAAYSATSIDLDELTGFGMISVLPVAYFVGLVLIVAGGVRSITEDDDVLAWAHLVAITILLHGLPGLAEPHPRFPVAWLHVGFADQIAPNGELLPLIDARFSWPGFFEAGAYIQRLAGSENLLWIVRFSPVVINLLAAVIVWNLARALGSDKRTANLASMFFLLANWVGQDYFSPQATGFLLSMTVLTVLLTCFPASPAGNGWRSRILRAPAVPEGGLQGRKATMAYIAIAITLLTLVVTHQLSPVFLGATLVLLAVVGRIRTPMLGVYLVIGVAVWTSFGAEAYWLGHLDKLVGSVGDVAGVVGQNVSERTVRSTPERRLVLRSRLFLAGVSWIVAGVILLVRRARGRLDPALAALLVGPFLPVVAQPYGGELLLRVAFFTLPIVTIIIAQALTGLRSSTAIVTLAICVGLIPAFMLARFGNESYEYVSTGDLIMTEELYRVAPDDSLVYVRNRQTLISLDRVGEVRFRSISGRDEVEATINGLVDASKEHDGNVYVLLTASQARYAEQVQGRPVGWLDEYADELLLDDRVTELVRSGEARLLQVRSDP